MGAGALPVDQHRRRPPIPIVPVDARARDAAAARGADPGAVWLAAVTGSADAPRIGTVDTSAIDVLGTTLAPFRDAAGMDVAHVALAVDAGRAIQVEDGNPEVVRYLNRLSDLLFILSRGANAGEEPLWEPGRYR